MFGLQGKDDLNTALRVAEWILVPPAAVLRCTHYCECLLFLRLGRFPLWIKATVGGYPEFFPQGPSQSHEWLCATLTSPCFRLFSFGAA